MLFSILIANYNNSNYLTEALESVFAQTYPHWEVILVDDCSTDDFETVVKPYREDTRIRIFRNLSNKGCGFTKRRSAALTQGTLCAFLDPDDTLHPDALGVMVQAHTEHPECSMIYSTHFICNEVMEIKRIAEYVKPLPAGIPYLLLGDGSVHVFAAFKKSAYEQTQGLSALFKKAVDKDLYYKLEEVGPFRYIDRPLYYYRIHNRSISNAGQEASAMLIHYAVAREACLRRIKQLKKDKLPETKSLIAEYRARYYKLSAFQYFRTKKWLRLTGSLVMFPLAGGMKNFIRYMKKLPKQGLTLLRKSFIENYQIKAEE